MTVQFRRTDEVKGINDFGQQYSRQIYNATLAAATNTQLTVPGGGIMGGITSYGSSIDKNKAIFEATSNSTATGSYYLGNYTASAEL